MIEGALRYAEDYTPGDVFDLGAYDVTRDEILEFSRKYDPFPFHVDEEAARATVYGGTHRQRLADGSGLASAAA